MKDKVKDFPIEVIASITSGKLLCKFNALHEAAEWLMGHPIWTHHFADKELWSEMTRTVLEQCPGIPTNLDNITVDNRKEKIRELISEFGESVSIREGSGLTARLPTDGIPNRLKNKTIILER